MSHDHPAAGNGPDHRDRAHDGTPGHFDHLGDAGNPDDRALRDAMRLGLRAEQPPEADSAALAQRVLAQWRQGQAQQAGQAGQVSQAGRTGQAVLAGSGAGTGADAGSGTALVFGGPRRPAWLAPGLVAVALGVALAAWWLRPDPALNELLQPDVLSQMGLGEL